MCYETLGIRGRRVVAHKRVFIRATGPTLLSETQTCTSNLVSIQKAGQVSAVFHNKCIQTASLMHFLHE